MAIDRNNKNGLIKNPVVRVLLLIAGCIFICLALIGIVLPLVPTTPFLLVAAACFYKSSPRFYAWLMTNKLFGKYIRDYKDKKGVPWKVKLGTLILLWASLLVSAFVFVSLLWVKILLLVIGAGVTIHIFLIRTKKG